jgi:hypothetical protein
MATRVPPALNLAVLCSYVDFDADQRPFSLNEPLYALALIPAARGRLPGTEIELYVQFDDEHAKGTFWFSAEVRTPSGIVIPGGRSDRAELTFTGDPDPLVPVEHVFRLRVLVFPAPGRYHFHVMCNHLSLHERPSAPPPSVLRILPAEAPG